MTHLGKLLWEFRFKERITCEAIAYGLGYSAAKGARKILAGVCGYTENDLYMPVKIEGLEDGFREEATVGELAKVEKSR